MNEEYTNGRRDPDTFDVRASLLSIADAIRYHKLLVVLTSFMTVAVVAAYVYIWPPVYTATATLMVERDTDPVRDTFYIGWNVFRKDDARTEIELMTAGPVLKEVIEREKLTYDDVYHPFMSHLAYVWETSAVGRKYREIKRSLLGVDMELPSAEELDLARTIIDMKAGVSIEPVGESNVGKLTVSGPSRRVARIANSILDVYLAQRTTRHEAEATRSYDILTDQVALATRDLKEVESRRLAFSAEHTLAFDFQKESLEIGKLTELEENIGTSEMKIAALEASLRTVNAQLAIEPGTKTTATVFEHNAIREAAKFKRFDVQTALIQARNVYREDSPEVQELKRNLASLEAVIAEASETVEKGTTEGLNVIRQELLSKRIAYQAELDGLRAGLVVLRVTADKLRNRLAELPSLQMALRSLDREYNMSQEKYQQLLAKQAQSAVSVTTAKATMPSMRLVEYAVPPADKSWPKTKILYPAGFVAGLTLGIIAAVVLSYVGGRVRREDVERGRGALPLYGTLNIAGHGRPFAVLPGSQPPAIIQATATSESASKESENTSPLEVKVKRSKAASESHT